MTKDLTTPFRAGDPVSASKLDAVRKGAQTALTVLNRDGMVDSMGITTRRLGSDDEVVAGVKPCQVYMDGGTTNGANDATCDRTYRFFDLDNHLLGTGQTPLKRRPQPGKLSVVGSGSAYGAVDYAQIGLYFERLSGGTTYYKLFDANETLAVQTCECD